MKERPILFTGPMVRAILEGRKTATRRIAKPVKHPDLGNIYAPGALVLEREPQHVIDRACPYGQPGDRLWVREAWGVISNTWDESGNMVDWTPDRPATPIRDLPFGSGYYSGHAIYAADGPMEWAGDDDGGGESRSAWKPSIHMPRAISRILLEITAVRVERLQDITDDQAEAEGVERPENITNVDVWDGAERELFNAMNQPRARFRRLWSDINGSESWDSNPWVWVVEFKRVTP
ncbi:TPA: hypothetical protein ACGJRO_004080 [Pseudomonas aeruginosa]|uniref:hypothetical protein n=1 Tax=Pseudomonas aeruginosa TaxID=287 RepID=UPI00053CF5C4|nr:hypothetical protein [Pseudomonas aeruginosa]